MLKSGVLCLASSYSGTHGEVCSMRFLHNARDKLAKQNGKWWSGGRAMKDSQVYPMTFAGAVPCLTHVNVYRIHVGLLLAVETCNMFSQVADILMMRNRHSPVFLMATDVGRMLDDIAISLVHQVMLCRGA